MLKIGSIVAVSLVVLVASLSGIACGATATRTGESAGLLLTYREEGGIGGPRPALTVSKQGRATLRLGSCNVGYALGEPLTRRLRVALRRADLGSIAGDYPPPSGTADMITYVVRSAGHQVSIAPDPRYEAVLEQIEPLLGVIGNVIAKGRSKMPPGCAGGGAR
jgi:hypothetical protein